MDQFKVKVVGIMLKNGKMAYAHEIVNESQLDDAGRLVKGGYIEKYTAGDDEEESVSKKKASKTPPAGDPKGDDPTQ